MPSAIVAAKRAPQPRMGWKRGGEVSTRRGDSQGSLRLGELA